MARNGGRMQGLVGRAWGQVRAPLYRNAFLIMSTSVIGSALGFPFILIVTRLFSKPDLGYATALFSTVSLIAAFANLALGVALIRFLPETDEKTPLVNTCLTVAGLLAFGIGGAFILGVGLWAPSLSFILQSPVYIVAILLSTVAVTFSPIVDNIGYAMRRAEVATWRTTVNGLAKVGLLVILAGITLTSGRLGVFTAIALGYSVAVLVEWLVFIPRVMPGYRPRPSLQISRLRPMIHFSLGNYAAASIGAISILILPLFILNLLGPDGATSAGVYYVVYTVAGLLSIIPNATFTSFYAEASQKGARRHLDERQAVLLSLGLLAPGLAVMWVFADWLLEFIGGDASYVSLGVDAFHVLIFMSVAAFINGLLVTRIRIRKRSRPLIIGALITGVVVLSVSLALLPSTGIMGVAIAIVAGSFAATPYYYAVAHRSFRDEETPPLTPVQIQG